MTKLLVFSDLHLDTPFKWAPPGLARARRMALRTTLTRIMSLAEENDVDAILCAGDLYEHERFSPDTTAFLRQTFADSNRAVYLAPGNHDWYGPASLYRMADWTPNVHVFTEARFVPVDLIEGVTLWGAAHRAPANTDGFFENDFRVDRNGVNIALFHGSESAQLFYQESGKVPHAPFSAEQIEHSGLDHAFVGHFHTPRDAARHTYPGNPDPLTFGETGPRGAILATITPDGTVMCERHTVAASTVHDVSVDVTGATSSSDICAKAEAALQGLTGVARVTLHGDVAPEVDVRLSDLVGISSGLDAIVPRLGRIGVTYDLVSLAAEQTVRGQFVRDVQASTNLDENQRRRVLVTGLRALDGRTSELEVH
ncbi:metallophosphoesterase [Cellulomonas flavigena DSM 20109]|uniref:Metallophosphoesterase n=1 Tax=Cellulomonas flavigena (strain ATCC 482 / DSM 20109 / BCRC 11376 / JCM 18109 / NBRC 3775 / NCIMB 8073 / NRS 134) TaxID=446466 RepID=D5UC04_CELFN|nr:metallophosphoesterase [Cellulomonas flavigena]ADG76163.1 metallophosphoesterase [Cellulomonas flavigena DSM 20109]